MWGALIGGLVAGIASGAMSAYSARQQQEATINAYKHRHQWQVADLRAAGLNPVLSATQGAGSVGSMAQMQTPDVADSIQSASAASLNKEQAITQKTTQAQQLTQADANVKTAEHQAASAREASARADIAEQVASEYKKQPALAERKALTDAGYNANTPLGAVSGAVHALGTRATNAYNNYTDGGSINVTRPRGHSARSVNYRGSGRFEY